jgi:hypothetical protein
VPELAPDTVVSICALGEAAVQTLREQGGVPESFLVSLEQVQRQVSQPSSGQGKLEEVFTTQERLEQLLERHLAPTHRVLVPEVLRCGQVQRALVHEIPPSDDFTFFVARRERQPQANAKADTADPIESLLGGPIKTHRDGAMWLWDDRAQRAASGRVLVCSCSRGSEWSVTFRRQAEYPARPRLDRYLNTLADISNLLYSTIIAMSGANEHGLVVITGRTGSGKSQIAHKLIQRYLAAAAGSSLRDRPHFVSFENPIEKDFRQAGIGDVDCTQREEPEDASSLTEVLRSALRQNPAVLFVGETRHGSDWKRLLEFSGTGHLVFTTAHAGSLVEAVGNILKETEASTPATRSIVADRLLAVIHVKNATDVTTGKPFLIPAIWHRTPLGIKALMAEGLSSLLPNTPPALGSGPNQAHLPGSVGRYWFARELTKETGDTGTVEMVKRRALEWDLEGI